MSIFKIKLLEARFSETNKFSNLFKNPGEKIIDS